MTDTRSESGDWIPTVIRALGNLHCGQSPPSETVNQNGLGTPYISGPEQWDGFQIQMSKWTTARCLVAPANSIFITVKGAGVGKMFPGTTAAIGQDIYAFEPSIEMDYAFIYRALQYSIQDVIAKAHGDIPGLTKDHILSHGIMVPGPRTQRAVSSRIEELFSTLDEADKALDRVRSLGERRRVLPLKAASTRLRLAILREAFTGKLVPHDPTDEPASVLLERIATERAVPPKRVAPKQARKKKVKA
jgi:type I restriction enzyme, S subunit